MDTETIGARVIALRALTIDPDDPDGGPLTARRLSVLAGFAPSHVGMIEAGAGASQFPRYDTVATLARVLGCSTDYLGTGKGAVPSAAQVRAACDAERVRKARRDAGEAAK